MDEIDILSISKVEAEFLYNESDTITAGVNEETKKKIINLDSFQIIKVIGKGEYFLFLFHFYCSCCQSSSFRKFYLCYCLS